MRNTSKTIRLSQHARIQMSYRGTNEEEIIETIKTCSWKPSELNRMECKKDFEYDKEWNNKYYKTKQVRPIFREKEREIIIVTVYVYYF